MFPLSGPYFPSQLPAACCPPFNDTTVGKALISVFLVYVSLSESILLLLVSSCALPKPERNVGWEYFKVGYFKTILLLEGGGIYLLSVTTRNA